MLRNMLCIVVFLLHIQYNQMMCVPLIWGFIQSPFEINRDRAHATSKHHSRLRCRWTLCPFITHALNLLAVISLAAGEGIRGHLTSCSLCPLWQMAKHSYFSGSLTSCIPSSVNASFWWSFPVSDYSLPCCFMSVYAHVFLSPLTWLSLASAVSYVHTHNLHTCTHMLKHT